MPLPQYSAENFRDALLHLLPLGPLWTRTKESNLGKLFLILGRVYQRNTARATALIRDLFPGSTASFLNEWEKTLALPDSCTGQLDTQKQRRGAIIAKLTDEGGSSVAYYLDLAAHFGVRITIEECAPARAGLLRAGQPCNGSDWAFAWDVSLRHLTITDFRAGLSTANDSLRDWQQGYIECLIRRHAPAHTCVLFRYLSADTKA